ncbi:MAG TPA: ABC transporter permease [Bacteroidia bacterium]|nr:ABC transporter permease [Bacteroidia bacterium]HNU34703.1 ABC transporter permease [Bacteroidia bacterium]
MKKYSQTKAMLAIAKASFRSIMRSPSAVVFTLAFPLIFILVFGFLGGGGARVDVGVSSKCDRNNIFFESIQKVPTLRFHYESDSVQMKELSKGSYDGILTIAKNPIGSLTAYNVDVKTSTASPQNGDLIFRIMQNVSNQLNLINAEVKNKITEVRTQEIPGRAYKSIDFILPGQLGFSLLSSGVFGTAFVFFSLRQTLVIKRFFATPVKRIYIVLGEAISRMSFAILGAMFIIGIGHFAFGFTLINGLETFLTMLLLSAIGLVLFMGFGFIISGLAKSESTIPPLANIITLPQFLLSGTFFSVEAFPAWLQPICKILPLTYLNDAMRKVAFEGLKIYQILPQLGIIALWTVIVYTVATKTFKWE